MGQPLLFVIFPESFVIMACARLDISDILEDGKNLKQIVCPRCGSKILPPKMGTYEETEFELQSMKKESAGTVELLDQFLGLRICLILTIWDSPTQWST